MPYNLVVVLSVPLQRAHIQRACNIKTHTHIQRQNEKTDIVLRSFTHLLCAGLEACVLVWSDVC